MRWTFVSAVLVVLPVVSLAQAPTLGPATAITVSGPVVGGQMTLVWSAVPGATHYHVLVADATEGRLDHYYPVEEAGCASSGVCTLTLPTNGFTPGAGRWWVRAWSVTAEGPWSEASAFTYVEVRVDGTLVTRTASAATSAATGSASAAGSRTDTGTAVTVVPEVAGTYSTAYGVGALFSETTGDTNSAFGYGALLYNTTGWYNTATGADALRSNTTGQENTATGFAALRSNTTGERNAATGFAALDRNTTGWYNTATGAWALYSNTTGLHNTAAGDSALSSNTTGWYNTATGAKALFHNTTGTNNTAAGYFALYSNTTGLDNTATGIYALYSNTTGSANTATGIGALFSNTTGTNNTAVGHQALNVTTLFPNNTGVGYRALHKVAGMNNTALGYLAGFSLQTGTNNLYLDNLGQPTESQTIRVGDTQTRAFIQGIRGRTTGQANAVAVLIDSNGQLGTINSSRRFKEDIRDMGEASSGLLRLRPVTFRYKEPYADGSQPIEYGLIAEEVAEVYPDLVVYDETGQAETVQYHEVNALLLNEVQKLARENQAQADRMREQGEQIRAQTEDYRRQAARIEALEHQMQALLAALHRTRWADE